ncbi:MAG TPA: serine hydrolase [Chitinophagaceae bacterium]|nr:serine hydrolase [Chitinophagaceae bacterium]
MKFLVGFLFMWSINACAIPKDTTENINKLMSSLYERGQFNGSILVAVNEKIIYTNGFGESNFDTHAKFTPATLSCLASVSKQFTAMTITMLAEQNKIKYDDPVSKYIPELSKYTDGITIRHLLTHTSGIPDVGDLGIDHPGLTNDEVLKTLVKQNSLAFKPGAKYEYSNTGYILLSIVVERITGKPFKDYLTEKILSPLKMNNTFLYDGSQQLSNNIAMGYSQFNQKDGYTGLTTGDGGMFSNVYDLLKWSEALYSEELVKQSTLDTAFTPAKVIEGKTTYGFGWNITGTGTDKVVWHTGSTGGYRAFIERRLRDRITIIMLTNKGNSRRMEINDAIVNILNDKPYSLPKLPISEKMYNTIKERGINFALNMYDSLKAANDTTYDFAESELNTLGYQLVSENKLNDAIAIFKLNTTSYPKSSNAFDSLGDAYFAIHDKDDAIKSYQMAIDLDKNNFESIRKLNNLKKIK